MNNVIITQELALEYFEYHPDGFLIWKKTTSNRALVGDVAGNMNVLGYIRIGFFTKSIYAHRLIFLFHHGRMPKEVDHINTSKRDNRIENLRCATHSENSKNAGLCKNNTSGHTGICHGTICRII